MLFNSITFVAFFIIVCGLYWSLHRSYRWQNMLLLAASYFFYGWWDVRFLLLVVLSTVVDYCSTISIDKGRMTLGQRIKASGFLVLAAFFFVTLKWQAVDLVSAGGAIPDIVVRWSDLLPASIREGWMFLAVVLGVVAYNLIYPLITSLPHVLSRKVFLFVSVLINLSILGVFKYFDFFTDSLLSLCQTLFNITPRASTLNIILPVGISFYTFKTISHTVDVYRKKISSTSSLLEVAAYVSFFPQLLAGPIERGKSLLPQFQRSRTINALELREGLWLISWGLYKKVVVADNLAKLVNETFEPFGNLTGAVTVPEDGMRLLMAIYAFALQIYCDFSGYTDIARGTAKLFGFKTMLNFNLPYFARSPSDFWRRWHISLSTWLRDYLYIPLGGNRHGAYKMYRNLMITMLLGGLWHGAAWTFVLWGAFHGIILILYRVLAPDFDENRPKPWLWVVQSLVMFHVICFGWLIFRADNLTTISVFLQSIFLHPHWSPAAVGALRSLVFYSWFLVLFQIVQGLVGKLNPMAQWPWFVRLNVWLFVLMSLITLASTGGQEFIYFAF